MKVLLAFQHGFNVLGLELCLFIDHDLTFEA